MQDRPGKLSSAGAAASTSMRDGWLGCDMQPQSPSPWGRYRRGPSRSPRIVRHNRPPPGPSKVSGSASDPGSTWYAFPSVRGLVRVGAVRSASVDWTPTPPHRGERDKLQRSLRSCGKRSSVPDSARSSRITTSPGPPRDESEKDSGRSGIGPPACPEDTMKAEGDSGSRKGGSSPCGSQKERRRCFPSCPIMPPCCAPPCCAPRAPLQ
jgi:hypothetical protein